MSKINGLTDAEYSALIARCRVLPPEGNYLYDDYIENLLLTVLDFRKRTTTVQRAAQHYLTHRRGSIRTHQHLIQLLAEYPDTKEGNTQVAQYLWGYNFWDRVELLRRLVAYFETAGVTTQEDLQRWATRTEYKDFDGKVKGARFAIYKWLVMRLGVETIKPDVWVHRFVQSAIGRSVNDIVAVDALEQAARDVGLRAYELDWRIWEYQRSLPASPDG